MTLDTTTLINPSEPNFTQTHPDVEVKTPLAARHSFTKLRPSSHDPYSLCARIYSFILWLLECIGLYSPPSTYKFKAAIQSTPTRSETVALFKQCLSIENGDLSLLNQYEALIQEIKELNLYVDQERKIKEIVNFRKSFKQRFDRLHEGERLLVPLTTREEVAVFYLVEKSRSGYSLKIIGCDHWMAELGGPCHKKIMGGKEKVLSQIHYKDIPFDQFNDKLVAQLFCNPLMEGAFNAKAFVGVLASLGRYRVNLAERADLWVTQSKEPYKAIGLVLQEARVNPEESGKVMRKRLEFRTRLFTLFKLFKEARFYLERDPQYRITLRYLIGEVSKEATLLAKKGYLTKEDLREVHSEIEFIEKIVQKTENRIAVSSASLGKLNALTLQMTTHSIQAPVTIPKAETSFSSFTSTPVVSGPLPKLPIAQDVELMTEAEEKIFDSHEIRPILQLLNEKKVLMQQLAEHEEIQLVFAHYISVAQHLGQTFTEHNKDRFYKWPNGLSVEDTRVLQQITLDMTNLVMQYAVVALPNVITAMLHLTKISAWAWRSVHWKGDGSDDKLMKQEEFDAMLQFEGYKQHISVFPTDPPERSFFLLDDENILGSDFVAREGWDLTTATRHPTDDIRRTMEDLYKQQRACFEKFVQLVPGAKYNSEMEHLFYNPHQTQSPSKSVKNPYLFAALREFHLDVVHQNIIAKLHREGYFKKFNKSYSHSSTYDGNMQVDTFESRDWKKTDEEVDEMQRAFDRTESLKLPEAAHDNPYRVFEYQLQKLNESLKKSNEPAIQANPSFLQEFTKEELTDLLILLRAEYPQLEVAGFVKKHGHLLAKPDVRNFIEIALLDAGNRSLRHLLYYNTHFAFQLPDILLEEIERYKKRIQTDPSCREQLLFLLFLTRKFCQLYRGFENRLFADYYHAEDKKNFKQAIHQFETILNDHCAALQQTLDDPKLSAYHFRAGVELLYNKMWNPPYDLNEIVPLYYKFKLLPREPHDVDSNEIGKMERRYAALTQPLKKLHSDQLTPLLNHLCTAQGWATHGSKWTGSFPKFRNDLYEVNLVTAEVAELASGSTSTLLPQEISTSPAFIAIFHGLRVNSIRATTITRGETTVYFISNRENEVQGSVEVENGNLRFYRHIGSKIYQAVMIDQTEQLQPLRSLVGSVLHFSTEKSNEGLVLDSNGKMRFKVQLQHSTNTMEVLGIIDCRGTEEQGPYQIQTASSTKNPILIRLRQFEHGHDTILFLKGDSVEKLELVRYGVSFLYRNGKFFCEDLQHRSFFLDFTTTYKDIPHVLCLSSEEGGSKVLFPDLSAFKSSVITRTRTPSRIQMAWFFLKTWWTGKAPDLTGWIEREYIDGPQHEEGRALNGSLFDLRPQTGQLIIHEKQKIQSVVSLLTHAVFQHDYLLAAEGMKLLKLKDSDLTQLNISRLVRFLKPQPTDDGNAAAIKIKIVMALRKLMGKKREFVSVKKTITSHLKALFITYLRNGRKVDHNIQLTSDEFERAAKIVKKKDKALYDKHIRIYFLKKGSPVLFDRMTGIPQWKSHPDINHRDRLRRQRDAGLYGVDQLTIEILEQQVLTARPPPKPTVVLEKEGVPVLFNGTELAPYFDATPDPLPEVILPESGPDRATCEKASVEHLQKEMQFYKEKTGDRKRYSIKAGQLKRLQEMLEKTEASSRKNAQDLRQRVDTFLVSRRDPTRSLAIRAGLQKEATFHQIAVALLQRDLQSLQNQNLLDQELDLKELENLLREYFKAETAHLLFKQALKLIDQPHELYQLLTTKRFYSPERNPEFLVFEYLTQQVLRELGPGVNQIHLSLEILNNPSGVFQAKTGAGKTTALSALRGLMQANGSNLISFSLLPALYEQSKTILTEILGDVFNKKVYALRYDFKMPQVIREKLADGKIVVHSIFKGIYHELLLAIKEKGCFLTDYKPGLFQEKWIHLQDEFSKKIEKNEALPDIELEHFTYLTKILQLQLSHDWRGMDEFDVPNQSRHRLQVPLGTPLPLYPLLYQGTLRLYERLRSYEKLGLQHDLQAEQSSDSRKEFLRKLAEEIVAEEAPGNKRLLNYLLGEEDLSLDEITTDPAKKDLLTLYKDQISDFLPTALSKCSDNDYRRSADGIRTIPCNDGNPHESAQFDHPLEKINYTIQDYMQNGVAYKELHNWVDMLHKEDLKGDGAKKMFATFFPNHTFPKKPIDYPELDTLLSIVNKDWELIKRFLQIKLTSLTVSEEIISMSPQDTAAMFKHVSGLSATLGCPEELPDQFNAHPDKITGVLGEMAYRLIRRQDPAQPAIEFDPLNPLEIFNKGRYHAFIDGAGAARRYPPKDIALAFKTAQTHLKQVSYISKFTFVGDSEVSLLERGHVFTLETSRGTDIRLSPSAKAVMTINRTKTRDGLLQNEGRMRNPDQQIDTAYSVYNPEMRDLPSRLVHTSYNQGQVESVGLYYAQKQKPKSYVRTEAIVTLLRMWRSDQTPRENLKRSDPYFKKWRELFIEKQPHDYRVPGSYHARNYRVRKKNCTPAEVLKETRDLWIEKTEKELGLASVVPKLRALDWKSAILSKMPPLVVGNELDDHGVHVEQETEGEQEVHDEVTIEQQVENEQEVNPDQCGDVPAYRPWVRKQPPLYPFKDHFIPEIDPRIKFTVNFCPVEATDSFYPRKLFDHAMPPVRVLQIVFDQQTIYSLYSVTSKRTIKDVIVGDALDDVLHRPHDIFGGSSSAFGSVSAGKWYAATYDLKLRRFISGNTGKDIDDYKEDLYQIIAQIKLINGECDDYDELEWKGMTAFLLTVKDPAKLKNDIETEVLHNNPHKAAAFKFSRLYAELEKLEKLHAAASTT